AQFKNPSGQSIGSRTGRGAGVFADVNFAASAEVDVDWTSEWREQGLDACLVGAGGISRELRLEHVEADVVLRGADEIPETCEQKGSAIAGGKIVAEEHDPARARVRVEGIQRLA